ncbi:MAG TPA: TonB-dependent receptor [Verrucomicrobiae bacterium]|nr:TonB-dependent receptor [Verrucomicrobiae bacterium]
MRSRILPMALSLAFVLLAAALLPAQTFRGTILGTVTDSSGAVLPGAAVTVKNTGTGLQRSTTTSADGSYTLPELPIGTYTVTISLAGFETSITTGIIVDTSSERRVNAALKTGQVSTRVEVSGDLLPQVETTSTEIGGTLTSEAIESLPVNGRDYQKLIFMNPGVAGSPDQITDSPGSYGTFSMNGSRGRSNNFLLDGTDMNDGFRNDPAINEAGVFGDPATILPLDAVAELKVISNYEAEYGRNSGAVIDIVTKSGTNSLHGTGLEYFRSDQLGARNYFNSVGGENPFHNNQFGGSLGGPIVKDHTFFFADYEGQRESGAQGGTSCVPDPNQIAADEAAITGAGGTVNSVGSTLVGYFPTPNIASAAPSAAQIAAMGPSSSFDNGCPNGNNLSTSTLFNNKIDSLIGKVDQNFSSGLLTGRYYFGNSTQAFPFAQLAGGLLPGFDTVTPTRVQLVSISYVKNINASQVNEARLGWNRFAEQFYPQDHTFNPDSIGLETGVTNPFDLGLPQVSLDGFSPIGSTNSIPRRRVDANWHFIDNYSWKSGRHDLKFGYEFRRTTIQIVQDNTFRGKLGFSSATAGPGIPVTGASLTALLEGDPSSGKIASGDTLRHTAENNQSLYFQDEFRMTPRLTVNYGIRWDYFGVVHEKNNLFWQMSPANGGTEVQVGSSGGPGSLYNPDYNNFAPRIGLAYDVTGKGQTVIRAGWGLFYDAFSQDIFTGHAPYNCAFCPGPAYSAATISASGLSGNLLGAGPVFAGPSPLGDFFGANPNIRTPYVQNFNFNVQQQLTNKMVLQVGYVGAVGTKLFRFRDINQPTQAQITAFDLSQCTTWGQTAPNCYIAGFDGPDGVDYNVPRTAFPNFFYVNQEESSANSNYNSLQTSLRVNGWHGLTSQANFVWSHSIDNASDLEDFIPNASQPNNSFDPAAERGNSNFDIRRRFSWNLGYALPKLGGSMARLKNGWGVDSAVTLQDGQPFNLNYNFEGDYSGGGEGFDRPDVVGPIQYGSAPDNFLNLTSFQVPCTFGNTTANSGSGDSNCLAGTRHFGDMGRNSLRATSFKEWNFSVFKDTPISERVQLELRAEFFNFLNHPNFSNPILPGYIADPGVNGIDSNGRGEGSYALSATGDVGIGNPFLGGGGPRGVQFAGIIKF